MDKVGGVENYLIAADFEDYGNLDPSNDQLETFVSRVKNQTGGHPVIIYSTVGFWNGQDPSGDFDKYGADAAWEARVWSATEKRAFPKRFYPRWLRWYEQQTPRGLGGERSKFLQFTWGGRVGGLYVDTDVFRGSMDELRRLTVKNTYHRPADGEPRPETQSRTLPARRRTPRRPSTTA